MESKCIKCKGGLITDNITKEKFCNSCGYMPPPIELKTELWINKPEEIEESYALQLRAKRKIPNRVCKQICKKFKAIKPSGKKGRYQSGQVRCLTCEIFMTREGCVDINGNSATIETKGLRCKCCNYRVRSKPRNSTLKAMLIK